MNVEVDMEKNNVSNGELKPEAKEEQEADHLEAETVNRPHSLRILFKTAPSIRQVFYIQILPQKLISHRVGETKRNEATQLKTASRSRHIPKKKKKKMFVCNIFLSKVNQIKQQLCVEFKMKNLGPAKQVLGLRVTRSDGVVPIGQEQYIEKLLAKFNMVDHNAAPTSLDVIQRLTKEMVPATEEEKLNMKKHSVQRTRWRIRCALYQTGHQSCGKSGQQLL